MRNYEMKFIIDLLVNWFTQYKEIIIMRFTNDFCFLGGKSYVYLYNLGLSEHHYSLTLDLSVNKKVVFLSQHVMIEYCRIVL